MIPINFGVVSLQNKLGEGRWGFAETCPPDHTVAILLLPWAQPDPSQYPALLGQPEKPYAVAFCSLKTLRWEASGKWLHPVPACIRSSPRHIVPGSKGVTQPAFMVSHREKPALINQRQKGCQMVPGSLCSRGHPSDPVLLSTGGVPSDSWAMTL